MKKSFSLIGIGVLNVLHGSIHLLQAIQSIFIVTATENSWTHTLMESPYMAPVWIFIGVVSLVLGYRDYKHHHKHKN